MPAILEIQTYAVLDLYDLVFPNPEDFLQGAGHTIRREGHALRGPIKQQPIALSIHVADKRTWMVLKFHRGQIEHQSLSKIHFWLEGLNWSDQLFVDTQEP